jgi:beta-phosphoglucomutase-like phosphatase (HAD superfamily)
LGTDAKDCMVIEDALNGIQAAKSAWMKSAWKFGQDHTKEEFGMAEIVFENFSDIDLQDLEKVF